MIVLALALLGCPGVVEDSAVDTDTPLLAGPVLRHDPPAVALLEGENATLSVTATDTEGVAAVSIYVRAEGSEVWEVFDAFPDETEADVYNALVPGLFVKPPAIEYYFKALDDDSPRITSYLPDGGFDAPLVAEVSKVGEPAPWTEDFEGNVSTLYGLGWREYSDAFEGYRWSLGAKAFSGTKAASHKRGGAGVLGLADWLVSPTLDLTTLSHPGVRWVQRGDFADLANHSLWLSTGSPDPADGDYVLVQKLAPAQEDVFANSEWVDLSAWGDQRGVTLAWKWEGELADAWIIDDVEVDEISPVLSLSNVRWDPVHPGGSTTIEATFENVSLVDSLGGTVSAALVGVDSAVAAGLDGTEQALDAVVAGSTVVASFDWTVPAATDDNVLVPLQISGTIGDESWTWDSELVIGHRSAAVATVTATAPIVVDISAVAFEPLVAGEELTIAEERTVFTGTLQPGTHALDADLTGLLDRLPPGPGGTRWALRVDPEGQGRVDGFRIVHDLQTWHSEQQGDFYAGTSVHYFLPPPPAPYVSKHVSTPDPAAPGAVVDWTITALNAVAPTTGKTTVSLVSDDPGATVLSGGPIVVSDTRWLPNQPRDLPFQVAVADSHRNSQDVALHLLVEDELESFSVPVNLSVPWPVLSMTAVEIDDKLGGNNDGKLQVGESVSLELDVTNIGLLDTFGGVSCELSIVDAPAGVTVLEGTANFGRIKSYQTSNDDRPQIAIDAGYSGGAFELQLDCADSATSYTATYGPVELNAGLWRSVSPLGDPLGDARGGQLFDFWAAQYRTDGVTLDIAFENAVPFDPSVLFLEMVFLSQGADYDDYQVVSQSGNQVVRGWDRFFGYSTLSAASGLTVLDERTVMLSLELGPLGLNTDVITVGFGAGFCGAAGGSTYYCDSFPDGWGNANGYAESLMIDLDL